MAADNSNVICDHLLITGERRTRHMITMSFDGNTTETTITGRADTGISNKAYDDITTEIVNRMWESNACCNNWNSNEDRTQENLVDIEYTKGIIEGLISALQYTGNTVTINTTLTNKEDYAIYTKLIINNRDVWFIG